jgi:hypothetical protein
MGGERTNTGGWDEMRHHHHINSNNSDNNNNNNNNNNIGPFVKQTAALSEQECMDDNRQVMDESIRGATLLCVW